NSAGDYRASQQIRGESRAVGCVQEAQRQRRPRDGRRLSGRTRPLLSRRGRALAQGDQGRRNQGGVARLMGLGTALRRFPRSRFFGRMPSTMYVTASESRVLARIFGLLSEDVAERDVRESVGHHLLEL